MAPLLGVVLDPGHDVGTRESLRIFERLNFQNLARLQVDKSGDDGRCADVNSQTVQRSGRFDESLPIEEHPATVSGNGRIQHGRSGDVVETG